MIKMRRAINMYDVETSVDTECSNQPAQRILTKACVLCLLSYSVHPDEIYYLTENYTIGT